MKRYRSRWERGREGSVFESRQIGLDENGDTRDRITTFQKQNGRGDRFLYDDEGQLTDAWYNALDPAGTASGWTRKDHFDYDALGNRQGDYNYLAGRNGGSTPVRFTRRDNGLNQYVHWWPAGLDYVIYHDDNSPWPGYTSFPGNGVTMADGWLVASYNALNQPVAMVPFGWSDAIYFGYDPLGRCVKRWVGASGDVYSNPATYFHYDGWNLLQEGNNAWGPARVYVHGNRVDEIVWSYNTFTGEQAFHHYDARGHCTFLTGSTANILEQYEYDAFGQPYFFNSTAQPINSSIVGNRFLFTGREWLSDLKLYDYRNRLYQPELGRFLQPDPKHFTAGDYNLYRYCRNDPINKNDPTGLEFSDREVEFVEAIPGMFGKTEFRLSAGVGVVQNNGTFSLQVTKYDVTVTSKQVATTADGKARTPEAVDASKEHEGLHTSDIKTVHDANQNRVLQTGYPTREAAAKDAQKEANKLNREFGKAEAETKRHQPDEKWKNILQRELPGR